MRVGCVSDLHGNLPDASLLNGLSIDLLLIGGDIVPGYAHNEKHAALWLDTNFRNWLAKLDMQVVGVAGNHDFIFQKRKDLVPKGLGWTYLEDSACYFDPKQQSIIRAEHADLQLGHRPTFFKIYGSPWQPVFYNWAFNAEENELRRLWSLIHDDTDILLLHGPPRGYGDYSPYGRVHTGSPSLAQRIYEIQPKLVVAGHIHSAYGEYTMGETKMVNASYVDESYFPSNNVIVVEI